MTDRPTPATDPGARGRLAMAIATAVDSVPGVRRTAGQGVGVATQYRGGSCDGIQLSTEQVAVYIVANRLPLADVAEDVHRAVRRALEDLDDQRQVTVTIADLDLTSLPGSGLN